MMAQPLQRIIHARAGEQRQRQRLARCRFAGAVGDAVIHCRQVRQVEHIAHHGAPLRAHIAFDMVMLCKAEMDRDRLRRQPDFDLHLLLAVVLQQQPELFLVVAREQVRPGQRGFIGAGAFDEAERQPRIGAREGLGLHAHEGIAGTHMAQGFTVDETLQRVAQVGNAAVVDLLHARQRGGRIIEPFGRNEGADFGMDFAAGGHDGLLFGFLSS
jgi:hypothetical protein